MPVYTGLKSVSNVNYLQNIQGLQHEGLVGTNEELEERALYFIIK